MKTLIELYDDRPIENVLASEVFLPEHVLFLCPQSVADNTAVQNRLRKFYQHKGLNCTLVFIAVSVYDCNDIEKKLDAIVSQYKSCALDITGGNETALFACGRFCSKHSIPVFTYSRKSNCFYNVSTAPFAHCLRCTVKHTIDDCFIMVGGKTEKGRIDNTVLLGYRKYIDAFFDIFLRYLNIWSKLIKYIELASNNRDDAVSDNTGIGMRLYNNLPQIYNALADIEKLGLISNLSTAPKSARFDFLDSTARFWLRDVGSVLELYIYKQCLDMNFFDEIRLSTKVEWDGNIKTDSVRNEIDVMCIKGIIPLFISCKACKVETYALNELAVLRDRFGGKMAHAIIVTAYPCRLSTRRRASELGITVISLNDLRNKKVQSIIKYVYNK